MALMSFTVSITEFRQDALTDWLIKPSVQLVLRVNFVQLHHFHLLFNAQIWVWPLPSSVVTFILSEVIQRFLFECSGSSYKRSSYKKLAWVRYEPTIFAHLLQFHILFSVQILFWSLLSSVATLTLIKILQR